MAEPYIGEIRMFGFDYAPVGWAYCDGQMLTVQQNQALFAVVGITYGGDGRNTFGVPNLRGRVPVNYGQGRNLTPYPFAAVGGNETVTLTISQIANHNHSMSATNNDASSNLPANLYTSRHMDESKGFMYKTNPTLDAQFAMAAVGMTGENLGHENMQPYLTFNFCIALEGIFPVRP